MYRKRKNLAFSPIPFAKRREEGKKRQCQEIKL